MSDFNLASLTDQDPYVKKLKAALEKATGQSIPLVNIQKPQRTAGVSIRGVEMAMSGGQSITFLLRQDGDVYRVKINGKDYAMTGDLSPSYDPSFNAGIKELSSVIVDGQRAFQKRQASVRVNVPRPSGSTKSTVQLLKVAVEQEAEIDSVIAQKMAQRDLIKQQIAQKANHAPTGV